MRRDYCIPKYSFLAVFFLFLGLQSGVAQQIQEQDVPEAIRSAFKNASRGAVAVWEKGPKNIYEANFSHSGKTQVYVYSSRGQLMAKKMKASQAQIPTSVGQALAIDHPLGDVTGLYRVITRNKRKYYEAHLDVPGGKRRVNFDLAGSQFAVVEIPDPTTPTMMAANIEPTPTPTPTQEAPEMMRGDQEEAPEIDLSDDDLELIDDDIADLFEDDGLDDDLMDLGEDELLEDEDWENLILEEEDDDLDFAWDDPQLN